MELLGIADYKTMQEQMIYVDSPSSIPQNFQISKKEEAVSVLKRLLLLYSNYIKSSL